MVVSVPVRPVNRTRPCSRGELILQAITPLRQNRVWPRKTSIAEAVAKGGIADSKGLDKYQTSLRKVKPETQANTLIYSMREEADSIFYSFGLSNDDRKKYSTVLKKYEAHSVKRRNPIYERRSLVWVDRKKESL